MKHQQKVHIQCKTHPLRGVTNRETTWTQGEQENIAKSSHSSSPTFGSTTLSLSADSSQDPWHKAKVHLWSLDETGTKTASGHLFKGNVAPFATASTTSLPQQFHGLNDQCFRSTGNAVHLKKKQNCRGKCGTQLCENSLSQGPTPPQVLCLNQQSHLRATSLAHTSSTPHWIGPCPYQRRGWPTKPRLQTSLQIIQVMQIRLSAS